MSDVEECGLEGGDFVDFCGRQSVSVRVRFAEGKV